MKSKLQELNRLRETLSRPSRVGDQSFATTSPTATDSSQGPGSARISPNANVTSNSHFGGRVFDTPIYEIDLEDAGEEDTTTVDGDNGNADGRGAQSNNVSGDGNGSVGGDDFTRLTLDGSRDMGLTLSTSPKARSTGRNMFAGPPGSSPRHCRSPGAKSPLASSPRSNSPRANSPGARSDMSLASHVSGSTAYGRNGEALSTLGAAAALAAAHVGLPASAYHSPRTMASNGVSPLRNGASSAGDGSDNVGGGEGFGSSSLVNEVGKDSGTGSGSNGGGTIETPPPAMPPLPSNVSQLAAQFDMKSEGASSHAAGDATTTAGVAATAATAAAGAATGAAMSAAATMATRNGKVTKEVYGKDDAQSSSKPEASTLPWGGYLSGFSCLSVSEQINTPSADTASGSPNPWMWGTGVTPGTTPGAAPDETAPSMSPSSSRVSPTPVSRLPQVDDEDDDDNDDDRDHQGGKNYPFKRASSRELGLSAFDSGAGSVDSAEDAMATSAAERDISTAGLSRSLQRVIAMSRERVITPELTPVKEGVREQSGFFSDSDTESEVSSRASSACGTAGRRASRDPAALLAAAIAKAGQIAAIPPPSAGSPGQDGKALKPVKEVPGEDSSVTITCVSTRMTALEEKGEGDAEGEVVGIYSPPHRHQAAQPSPFNGSDDSRFSQEAVTPSTVATVIPPPATRPCLGDTKDEEPEAGELVEEMKVGYAEHTAEVQPGDDDDEEYRGSAGFGIEEAEKNKSETDEEPAEGDSEMEVDSDDGDAPRKQDEQGAAEAYPHVVQVSAAAPETSEWISSPDVEAVLDQETITMPHDGQATQASFDDDAPRDDTSALNSPATGVDGSDHHHGKSSGFSLKGALSEFLHKRDGKKNARVPGKLDSSPTLREDAAAQAPSSISPPSHTLKVWPSAMTNSARKHVPRDGRDQDDCDEVQEDGVDTLDVGGVEEGGDGMGSGLRMLSPRTKLPELVLPSSGVAENGEGPMPVTFFEIALAVNLSVNHHCSCNQFSVHQSWFLLQQLSMLLSHM